MLSAYTGGSTDHEEVRHGSRIRMQALLARQGNLLRQQWPGEGTSQLGSVTRQQRKEAEQGEPEFWFLVLVCDAAKGKS